MSGLWWLLFVCVGVSCAAAQGLAQAPAYPRVSLAATYEVDPTWPQKPPGFAWEAVPGVAVDPQDNVWVFTRAKPPVQAYTAGGKFLRAWGEKTIHTAHHLKVGPDGNIWIADIGHHVVRKFSPQGEVLLTIGTEGEPGSSKTHLNQPTDMAIAPSGHVFVADGYGNNRIVHFDPHGNFVKAWGQLGTGLTDLSLPHAIAMDVQGRLYVADRNNVRVMVYDQGGQVLDQWSDLLVPWGFGRTRTNHLWVCGSSPMGWKRHPDYPDAPLGCPPKDQILMKFDTRGRVQQLATVPKGRDGQERAGEVNWVHAVAEDSRGNLYVGDIMGKRAQKFVRTPGRRDAAVQARVKAALPTVEAVGAAVGGEVTYLEVATRPGFVIQPRGEPPSLPRPWVWYAPTIGGQPRPAHAFMFRQFLQRGIAVAGIDVGESMGNPQGRAVYRRFYQEVTETHGLAKRACLIPQSRGGLMLYNWAAEHAQQVACIAGIYTVCDMTSWPGLERASTAYGLRAEQLQASLHEHNPIERLAPLAQAKVPILHIHGDSDRPVPLERHAGELVRRYRELGGEAELIVIPGRGHEEASEIFQCQPFVDFVLRHALRGNSQR